MNKSKPRFSVSVDCDLYDKINTYQHEHRIKSQTQAITEILKIGIQAILAEDTHKRESENSNDLTIALSDQLLEIFRIYDAMNCVGQEKLLEYSKDLSDNVRYKKCDSVSTENAG